MLTQTKSLASPMASNLPNLTQLSSVTSESGSDS